MNTGRLITGTTALVALLLASSAAAQTPPLGRLFLTPDARAHLERQRQLDIKETRNLEGGTMRLDGVVVRSSGKSTVWVNNQPQNERENTTGVTAATSTRQPGRARLTTGDEAPADLKVGVTLNRATRETEGGLAGGEIRIKR
ncbi:MAG: hypothetical protein RBS28_03255 [Rhodocyclaceae bacterium]|jgi:hypothetical protein|nr:hypothetical protein [Rhodocyclaceae bacterium]